MMTAPKNNKPSGDGERAAISGYFPQYQVAASIILQHLRKGTFEWIKIADPNAGSMDDIQIASPGRLDAYQVKWSQYSSNVTYNNFISPSKDKEAPLLQLAKGWTTLCNSNSNRQVWVHWLTNDQASPNDAANIPTPETKPTPCHFASFLEQVLFPIKEKGEKAPSIPNLWKPAFEKWLKSTKLPEQDQIVFLHHCELDLRYILPLERPLNSVDDKTTADQIRNLTEWLLEQAAGKERQIQFYQEDILFALGINELPGATLKQDFPIDEKIYRPIETSISKLEQLIKTAKGGYIALTGSPGSGKSTLLTQHFRYKPIRLARYYAYVPNTRDISALRGESISFLGSIINQFDSLGLTVGRAIQTNDREAMLQRFKSQIDLLHNKYKEDGKIAVLLIDGLDHIHRELKPERSLLADLPRPEEIPEGVFIFLGSQTLNLPDLPNIIRQHVTENNRFVTIDSLTRKDVLDITNSVGLSFDSEQSVGDRIFELSAGHPLALRYLLEKLQNVQNEDSANVILENGEIWKGDIDQHYQSYWSQIQPKDDVVDFLGLISRIPGSIDLTWIYSWPESDILRKVDDQFGYLFRKESKVRWALFHNSFRLFIIEKTRQIQPGLDPEVCDRRYHAKLAEHCDIGNCPLESSWNKTYHLERAAQHENIIANITQDSLRKQLYALRPRYSIWEDIFSGLRSTAILQDPVALMRLILAGQELESRQEALRHGNLDVPDILIQIGEYEKALLHIRDGYQLMVSEYTGLECSSLLFDSGRTTDALEVFELSEPIEYLSGSTALKIHPNTETTTILTGWVKASARFRTLQEILSVIPKIQAVWEIKNKSLKGRDPSREIQDDMYITLGKELVFLERYDDFHELFEYAGKNIEDSFGICFELLLILYDSFYFNQQSEQANKVIKRIEELSEGHQLYEWQRLWIARGLARSNGDKEKIRKLISDIPLLQNPDNYSSSNYRPLDDLKWDMVHVAINCFLGDNANLTELVPDPEESEHKGSVLFRRAVAAIGQIIGSAWRGELLDDAILRQTYLPILKLFNRDWSKDREWMDWHSFHSDRGRLFEYLIQAVRLHGDLQLEKLKAAFENEWEGENTKKYWYTPTIRTVILELWKAGISDSWAIDNLEKLESDMLIGLDISGRIEALNDQINAWFELDEIGRPRKLLIRSLNATFGVGYRKDYQLDYWVKLYRKITNAVPGQALKRYQRIAEAIPSLEDSTEGQSSAARLLIEGIFEISPRRAVMLYFTYWKSSIVSYQGGLGSLIRMALTTDDSNLILLIPLFTKLLIPLSRSVPDRIAKALIDKNFLVNGRSDTIDLGKRIVDSTDILALSHIRPGLRYAVAQSLQQCSITELSIANAPEPSPVEDRYSPEDRAMLELEDGQKMSLSQVIDEINNTNDFINLFERKKQFCYFDWIPVIEQVFSRLQTLEIDSLTKFLSEERESAQWLNVIAKQFLANANTNKAHETVRLAIRQIREGEGYTYDRLAQLASFALLKKIDRNEAINETYSFLVSELIGVERSYIFRSANDVLEDILDIVCENVPYEELGTELDNYIETLFANEQKTSIAFFNEEIQDDSVNRALADLACENVDHNVPIISQLAREVIIECLLEDIPEFVNAIKDELSNNSATISILIAIAKVSETANESLEALIPIILELSQSKNIVIAQMAEDIASNLSIEVPSLIPEEKITLPPIYSLVINEDQTWDIWYGGDLKEGEDLPDTQDPRELVKPNDAILRAVSKESGIPFVNLCMRAVQIVQEKGQDQLLSRGLEKQIVRQLEYTGLKMSYCRPRFRAMYPALLEVIGELIKAGRISDLPLKHFKELFHPYDPAFLAVNPVRRSEDIVPIPDVGDRTIELKNWIAKAPEYYMPENQVGGFTILGGESKFRSLSRGVPFEQRSTACFLEKENDLLFGQIVGSCVKDYSNFDLRNGHNCMVVRNSSFKTETGMIMWLAFNPSIAQELKWNLKTDGWFHWIDESGDTMTKSIWWKDGLIQWHDTHLGGEAVEVAEGWRVLITPKALSQIKGRFNNLIRINRILRNCYDDGIKNEKEYEWQSNI